MSLIDTRRVDINNQAIFTFQFSPALSRLSSFDLNSYFQFSCEGTLMTDVSWTSEGNGIVEATVSYDKDLEGKQAEVVFNFDTLFIPHDPINLEFDIKSKGLPLVYY